jgi:hypothetical protein
VKAGDFLEYRIDGKASLTLRACAKSDTTVTVAIEAHQATRPQGCSFLLDGVLVDVPKERLKPPPELPQPTEGVFGKKVGETYFPECGSWKGSVGFHLPMHDTIRCIAPELVLGGGLVSFTWSVMPINGRGESHETTLVKHGNDPAPCPAWPKAKLEGSWRFNNGTQLWDRQAVAGSAWVRIRNQELDMKTGTAKGAPGEEQSCLADMLIPSARDLPAAGSCRSSIQMVGGKPLPALALTAEDGVEIWPDPKALADAPLWVRIQPLERDDAKRKVLSRVESIKPAKR